LPGSASACHLGADAFWTAPIQLVRKIWRPTAARTFFQGQEGLWS
jgi:hypothetical protein